MKFIPSEEQNVSTQFSLMTLWFIAVFLIHSVLISPLLMLLLNADLSEILKLQELSEMIALRENTGDSQNLMLEGALEIKKQLSSNNFYFIYISEVLLNVSLFLFLGLFFRKHLFSLKERIPNWQSSKFILYFLCPLLLLGLFPLLDQSVKFNDWLGLNYLAEQFGADLEASGTANMIFSYAVLIPESRFEVISSLIVVAFLPALGEELFFRGTLQQLLIKHFKNPHNAIFITALIFSAIHFEFSGFFYRFFLGAILGYVYYWGKTLWLPIFIHLLNNALGVLIMYNLRNEISSVNLEEVQVGSGALFFSTATVALILFNFYAYHRRIENNKDIIE